MRPEMPHNHKCFRCQRLNLKQRSSWTPQTCAFFNSSLWLKRSFILVLISYICKHVMFSELIRMQKCLLELLSSLSVVHVMHFECSLSISPGLDWKYWFLDFNWFSFWCTDIDS